MPRSLLGAAYNKMTVEFIYWQKNNGLDGIAPHSLSVRHGIDILATRGLLKYYIEFPLEINDRDEMGGVSSYALNLVRYFLKETEHRKIYRFVQDKPKTDIDFSIGFIKLKQGVIDRFEQKYFKQLYELTNYNVTKMAQIAKVNRKSIYRIINKYRIKKPRTYCAELKGKIK